MRPVVLHYHYFKNAGTSVDAILSRNFPGRWLSAEFVGRDNHAEVGRWIMANPEACAFSTHTGQFPLPVLEGVAVLPIVFLRHPLDRIFSAYSFERKQKANTYGANLAKETDFAGYARARLHNSYDRHNRDFQTFRLSLLVPTSAGLEIDRALLALARLPFVGLVEDFRGSAHRMCAWLRASFPEFRYFEVRRNFTTAENFSLEERLEHVRREAGEELYAELLDANQNDIRVVAEARRIIDGLNAAA